MNRRDTLGFTLIEILAVMLVISILSAIAMPNFNSVREKAFVSTMKGDLHGLRFAQEVYNVEPNGAYATSLGQLSSLWAASENVEVTMTGDGEAWSAEASHPGTSIVCAYSTAVNLITCAEPDAGKK